MKPALMKPFNVQRQFNDAGSLGKIEIVPMDVSDLSCGESVCSSGTPSASKKTDFSRRRGVPRNERIPRNDRVSRKDRTKKRQSRRQRLEEQQGENSSCDEFEPHAGPRLRRASTVDNTACRRERPLAMSAPVAPLRRCSTGPMEVTNTRRLRRSGTGPTHTSTPPVPTNTAPLMPYGPLAPLAPSVPQRRASIRCSSIPEHMDDTSETVATTDHEDSGYEQYAYVYKPDLQSYEPVPIRMRRQRTSESQPQPSRALRQDPPQPAMMRQNTPDIRQQGRTFRGGSTDAPQIHIHTQGDVHVHRPIARPIAGMTTNSSNAGTPPQPQPPRQRRTSRKDRIQAKRSSDPNIVIMNPHDLLNSSNAANEELQMPSLGYQRSSTVDRISTSERKERSIPSLAAYRRTSTADCAFPLDRIHAAQAKAEQAKKTCDRNCSAEPSRHLYKRNRNASDPGFRRTSTMDSLPSKPRRRESVATGSTSLQRTRSQSLQEKKRWN